MSNNAKLASTVIQTTIDLGVTHFVICAGARNVPLIFDLAKRESIQLWNHFDERAAAFFALGLAKAELRPAAVVTTSGTAVAELLPAVIEACYAGIPLILITADRPVHFRGSGAPQAIEQVDIFHGYVSQFLDLSYRDEYYEEIYWNRKSPLHLNVCFEEPAADEPTTSPPLKINPPSIPKSDELLPSFDKPVAIIGELQKSDRDSVIRFLKKLQIPSWFEATSGLRENDELADFRIDTESTIAKLAPKEVIRIGGVPSLRYWRDLETDDSVKVINLTRTGFSGLARNQKVATYPLSILDNDFSDSIVSNESFNTIESTENQLSKHPESEPAIITRISEIISSDAAVFLGNSLPIREWNLAASHNVMHPNCFANRGANGIDGEVSTFLGISEGFDETWGIFGDLTSLYDLNAPWILGQLHTGKRRIVVLNNGGGRIFSRLPAMKSLGPNAMAMTENHHQIQFSAWAELWGIEHLVWKPGPDEWQLPQTDATIIEVQIDQAKSEAFWSDFQK